MAIDLKKEKFNVALDIGDRAVKIVAVSANKGEKGVILLDFAKLSSDNDKDTAKEIRSLISKNRIGKSPVSVSFPRHLVTMRHVRFPTASWEEVRKMAELQAIKFVPYSREEMVVSHKVVGITHDGYSNTLLVIAQRKAINRYMEIFKLAGLSIQKVALSSEGILNWYLELKVDDKKPVALIDLDRHHTHIQIFKEGRIVFSRSASFDTVDRDSDKTLLLREVKMSFDSFLKEQDENIERIIITGREEYAKNVSSFLSDNFSIPCEYFEQLKKIVVKESGRKSLNLLKEASYTHLLGIALEPDKLAIDLLPGDVIGRRQEAAMKTELIKTALLLLAVLFVIFGIIEKSITEKRLYLKKIDSKLKDIEPEAKRLLRLRENVELIQGQIKLKDSSVDILRELYTVLPKDTSLTLLEFEDGKRLLLRGTTKELDRVSNLLSVLEKSPYFTNVKINYTTKRSFKNTEFADFEIICGLP